MKLENLKLLLEMLESGLRGNGDKQPVTRWELIKWLTQVGILLYLVQTHE